MLTSKQRSKDELTQLLALGSTGNAVLCAAQRAAMED